ncbi:MAG: hypothetical protein R3C44_24290 [Chloroflexota bacterium]
MARLGLDIPLDNIQMVVLDYDYVYNETTPDGQQVLVPSAKIRTLRDGICSAPVPTPVIESLPEFMETENARVAIYNGTPTFSWPAKPRIISWAKASMSPILITLIRPPTLLPRLSTTAPTRIRYSS